ncbi:MAG: DNA-directed RNA polymerase subunit beta [Erysipelotrichales bacterium]|nr:DNA-directed RNA polymerase subunit beta [Erysipelotrichales bacterium]
MNYNNYKKLNNDRIDFSKISGTLELPYLVEIQTESYKEFLKHGIEETFKDVFPISNYAENVYIEYVGHRFLEPKYDWLECKNRDLTYCAPLKVTLRLRFNETGEIKEKEVFMGDFPLMTDSGTFIINGAERAIVSQIVRSPGAYLKKELDPKSGKYLYGGDLIPTRGTWLQFESDSKDILSVRIERQRKMPATILLKALGLETPEVLEDLFGDNIMLQKTIEKDADTKNASRALREIFLRLKPGEPYNESGAITFLTQRLFDPKRYDLGRAGRHKYITKLGVYNRLPGRVLAEHLISADGEVVYEKGTLLTIDMVNQLKEEKFFENGAHAIVLNTNTNLDTHSKVNIVKVYADEEQKRVVNIIGTDLDETLNCATISDIVATFSYFMNIIEGFGDTDDIDHLSNRRIRCVGELIQNQFRTGLTKMGKAVKDKMSISDLSEVTPQQLINIRPVTSAVKEFFASSQLSQFMDQTNPLAELTNKRRISALGPGGISRERASFAVRDVHYSHYGRICPIETPEGQNIGLINNLACYAKINKYGFIETPYRRVEKGTFRVLEEADYLSADQEKLYLIAEANTQLDENHCIMNDMVIARANGETVLAPREMIDYIDVSPKQIVSIAASCIPFLENDDTTRALMGANMQRQALPLLNPHAPFIGTGMEHYIAKDSGIAVVAKVDGLVKYVDSKRIVTTMNGEDKEYRLQKFMRSNQGTCINQRPIVKIGDQVKAGQVIADGPAMQNGDLALGQNVTIAFMTWNGYNYEDAVIMSERLVKDDVYTTIHIETYDCECRNTQLGREEYTRDVPNVSEDAKAYLDERGIIVPGAEVKEGDILVGKITPKGLTEPTAEEKLLMAIFADKTKDGKDTSLRVPHGGAGVVLDVKTFSRKNGDELPPKVDEMVRVYIVQKRKISEGDKMSGRHGNKGVISCILPVEDMPFLPDGTPIDIMLNPLGVPSRMNIGQILEIHLGMAAKKLGMKIATPVFDGISNEEIFDLMKKAELSPDGKTILYDGRTGDRFDERISVGVMYMIKLVHMVDDKLHARATGTYSIITQQPLGGKAQKGGQRFGEMEVWALEAYGAAHTLQEMMTIKSDDRVGRRKAYDAIIKQKDLPKPGMPEAFKLLTKELQALALDVRLFDGEGTEIDTSEISKQAEAEEHRISQTIRDLTENVGFDDEDAMSIVESLRNDD